MGRYRPGAMAAGRPCKPTDFLDRINKIYRRGNDRNRYLARTFQPREGRRNLAQGDRREPWEKGNDSFFETQPPKGVTEKKTEFKI